jgi:hypothetical protein
MVSGTVSRIEPGRSEKPSRETENKIALSEQSAAINNTPAARRELLPVANVPGNLIAAAKKM